MFLFQEKTKEIKTHNQNTKHTYKKAHNQFSCLTDEEFEKTYLGVVPPADALSVNSDAESASTESANTESGDESDSMSTD